MPAFTSSAAKVDAWEAVRCSLTGRGLQGDVGSWLLAQLFVEERSSSWRQHRLISEPRPVSGVAALELESLSCLIV